MSKVSERAKLDFDVAVIMAFTRWLADAEREVYGVRRFANNPTLVADLVERARKYRKRGSSEQESAKEAIRIGVVFVAQYIKPVDGVMLLCRAIAPWSFGMLNEYFTLPRSSEPQQQNNTEQPAATSAAAARLSELTTE